MKTILKITEIKCNNIFSLLVEQVFPITSSIIVYRSHRINVSIYRERTATSVHLSRFFLVSRIIRFSLFVAIAPRRGGEIAMQLYIDHDYGRIFDFHSFTTENFIFDIMQTGLSVSASRYLTLIETFRCVSFSVFAVNVSANKTAILFLH